MALFAHMAGVDVEAKDQAGATALHWACYQGSIDIVRFLVVRRVKGRRAGIETGWRWTGCWLTSC